jgi:hypothetical protein
MTTTKCVALARQNARSIRVCLEFFFGYFLFFKKKKVTIKKEFTAISSPSLSRKDSGQALQRGKGCQFDEGASNYFKNYPDCNESKPKNPCSLFVLRKM